ncbi:hypothetical protein GP486_005340 [Trichoglossum hirsutum]|uniref:PB1 domain-containing protein n=1 Tax=Trichoglossum hirsutum TaxID=265104 RepID=A0A9P8RMF7_9PEZI|nr:hypothetical protein GP486_005340 [Trichoglossum hirsutum]
MNETGEIVGMVDVLKLTYATLEQVNTMSSGDNEGPAWNKFWLSLDNETDSVMSGEGGSHHPHTPHRSAVSPELSRNALDRIDSSVLPNESASHHGGSPPHSAVMGQPMTSPEDTPFPFKFKAPSGRVHRLQVLPSSGLAAVIANVTEKLGSEIEAVGGEATFIDGKLGKSGYALSYLDDEGDTVSITTDRDLLDAITLARHGGREKVDLFVHDREKPPASVTLNPQPALAPAAEAMGERKKPASEDGEGEGEEEPVKRVRNVASPAQARQEELVPGVPNELLLPGAIVTLAVVIVAVFALSRSRR